MKNTLIAALFLASPALAQVATEDFTVATHSATGGNPGGMITATFSSGMANLFAPILIALLTWAPLVRQLYHSWCELLLI